MTVQSILFSEPTFPAIGLPVLIPIPISNVSLPSLALSFINGKVIKDPLIRCPVHSLSLISIQSIELPIINRLAVSEVRCGNEYVIMPVLIEVEVRVNYDVVVIICPLADVSIKPIY